MHCSAGISRFAFCLWLGATLLVTTNAVATGATVFIVLGGVQIVATALILLCATKYRFTYCACHMPVGLGAGTEQELIDPQMGGLGRGVRAPAPEVWTPPRRKEIDQEERRMADAPGLLDSQTS